MVATSDGIPNLTTMMPFSSPTSNPAPRQATNASSTLPVLSKTLTNPNIPIAMMEGNDRSISPAITIIVSGNAIMAKNGMVDIYAA